MNSRTLASNLVEHRQALAAGQSDQDPAWLVAMRELAFDRLRNRGMPTVKNEEWRYTDLKKLQKQVFSIPDPVDSNKAQFMLAETELTSSARYRLVFVNGLISIPLSPSVTVPAGVSLGSLSSGLVSHTDIVEGFLGSALPPEPHGFTCANSALFQDGALIIIGKGVKLDSPIELVFITSADKPIVAHPRNLVICEKFSQATVIERHIGGVGQPCLNNPVTEIFTDEGAHLDHYKIQAEQEDGFHTSGIFIAQKRDSNVVNNNIALGAMLARTDLIGRLNGPGARLEMNGLIVGNSRQHIDNCTEVIHASPSCKSDEYYKCVLDDRSRAVFRGRIVVAEDAQQTNADQQSKCLLLSNLSEADIKPQLEIYADDVKCSHGATVGQLDQNSIFYLRSRGIDEPSARSLLTYAFANDVIDRIPLPEVREQLSHHLAGRLLTDLGPGALL
jgi:Fe-S cluster assembly protein SufD